ncbi:MAG: ABC transporter ATP-binding protein [Flavobacteriales bacterium]|jgi:ABC-2 type transport system ATP-binding protein|nr:ABC transporter ATP-binding protein [Flavobacteriaceae bacterium]MDO7581563.1 ABC transporter ATP-binding protein [Flavobacteriaceae bacterium]MDO7590989.1 ABC transporter ATP-binding protein [Flavobacteriaceae bacterium]MDO7599070.1 ABC transporter ATP-binding protein [Flavobacteriaceae bacterium]MDO7604042.1 ABC transporter ATP-binding protein [Flavobacteriaceae bacterium]|tara:strand:- start:1 stop:696 length:696 start_codon:yes stop_codon:yes gene_type:complete
MITLQNLTKSYEDTTVLSIDQLEIPKGQCFGLVGNNGAGKTTLFSLLLDLIKTSTGEIVSNGIEVAKSEDWKSFTSAFIDDSFLIGYLTPEEYFYFVGELRGINKEAVDSFLETYKDFFNDEILDQKKYLRDFSKGNQKKVGLIATFLGSPNVIILDEPFANLDPTTQIRLKQLIKKETESREITLLISSHDLNHVTDVCNRIVLLERGSVIMDKETTSKTLQELEAYFSA